MVSNYCNSRNGQCSSNNNISKWIFIAIHVYAIQITKTLVTINRKYLRKIMCKNPIAFQIKNTFF